MNRRRGDELRAQLHHRARLLLDHLDKLGVATANTSGFPWSSWPWPTPPTWTRSAGTCSAGAST
jgi:hypothetical protein